MRSMTHPYTNLEGKLMEMIEPICKRQFWLPKRQKNDIIAELSPTFTPGRGAKQNLAQAHRSQIKHPQAARRQPRRSGS